MAGAAARHPCRGAPCATPAFGLSERGSRSEDPKQSNSHGKIKRSQPGSLDSSYRGRACTHASHHSTGRALARLQLLISMHRPLERPSGGSAQWATRHGCRVSRPRPWMADGGGPTEQDRSEGMPSQARHRTKGARVFGYFALFKVTRCKSETDSRRDRRNGYAHKKQNTARPPRSDPKTPSLRMCTPENTELK